MGILDGTCWISKLRLAPETEVCKIDCQLYVKQRRSIFIAVNYQPNYFAMRQLIRSSQGCP